MVEIKGSAVLDSITGIKKRDGDPAYEAIVSRLTGETKKMFQSTVGRTGRLGEWQRRSAGYAFRKSR